MKSVKIDRTKLLETITANRTNHKVTHTEAVAAYRSKAIEELTKMLEQAKSGGEVVRHLTIPKPEEHLADYDRVIAMLEMSVDGFVELASHEFEMYVLDKWTWQDSFTSSNKPYLSR